MKHMFNIQLWWVLLFALSMAFFESAMVVYLREIYYPGGFAFPLKIIEGHIVVTELLREAFSLLMIVSVAVLAGKTALQRFGYFLMIFAVWDIFYYVFLKLLLDWPASLLTQDVLFLIPLTWTGPVIAPVINSLMMLVLGWVLVSAVMVRRHAVVKPLAWVLLIGGSVLVMMAYMQEYMVHMTGQFSLWELFTTPKAPALMEKAAVFVPNNFPWWLYLLGIAMHLAAIVLTVRQNSGSHK